MMGLSAAVTTVNAFLVPDRIVVGFGAEGASSCSFLMILQSSADSAPAILQLSGTKIKKNLHWTEGRDNLDQVGAEFLSSSMEFINLLPVHPFHLHNGMKGRSK
jgi:hypothetical protein